MNLKKAMFQVCGIDPEFRLLVLSSNSPKSNRCLYKRHTESLRRESHVKTELERCSHKPENAGPLGAGEAKGSLLEPFAEAQPWRRLVLDPGSPEPRDNTFLIL